MESGEGVDVDQEWDQEKEQKYSSKEIQSRSMGGRQELEGALLHKSV